MSLQMVPFKSLGAVSYSPSIVTMAVSVAICDIFSAPPWKRTHLLFYSNPWGLCA